MKRGIVITLIIVLGILLVTCGLNWADNRSNPLTDRGAPGIDEAAIYVRTPGYVYYTDRLESQPERGEYTLHGYWSYDNGKWREYKVTITIKAKYLGEITTGPRRE